MNENNFKKNFENNRPHYEGMGLGLFISKTLLENLGAKVTFNNDKNSKTEKGAIVRIIFDRKKIEVKSNNKIMKSMIEKKEANEK